MNAETLQLRTQEFSLRIIGFFRRLPKNEVSEILGKQLLRCATSVMANYRAARRARSLREFYAKICVVTEEADEALMWLELIEKSDTSCDSELDKLLAESKELLFMFSATRKSTRLSLDKQKRQ